MSRGYIFFLIIGLFVIYKLYKYAMERHQVDWAMEIRDGETWKSNKSIRARKQKAAFQTTSVLAAIDYLLIVLNLSFNIVPAWYLLALTGLITSYCYWLINKIPAEIKMLDASPEEMAEINYELAGLKKGVLIFLAVSIVASGNWAYQVTKNQGLERESATNEALSLVGQGWCSNAWSQKTYRDGDGDIEFVNSGGWPCITVRGVRSISFKSIKDSSEMCFWYQLNRSNSHPDDIDSETDFDYRKLCATDRWLEGGGWTESNFSDEIYKGIKPDLDVLQKDLCSLYYYRLDGEQRSVYC